ncbi:M16 peptidase-like protein [Aureococcus anophagefferens]|nr:M16 peptidase-like protein [Aureococcus anophagefferens]
MAAVALLALVVSATLSLKPSALGPAAPAEAVEIVLDDADIERPAVDRRRYRLVRLANGVEALLVSDGDADEAGARCPSRPAADDTRLGLAHFHEHMLFLGTRKYPDEDEYEAYLNAHGGGSNAWTADEETCYYLNVNAGALDGALDRLAQFFVDPLLSLDCVEREVKAVDSEYAMALQDDGWRMLSVLKATANGAHPESLDELEKLVAGDGRFGAIPSSGAGRAKAPRVTPWAAESEEVPRVVKVVPVRDWRSLQLLWPLPARSTLHERGATPELFVSHLLGHEGEESLHALLRDRGWVDALSCGTAAKFDDAQLFELSVDLTELGEARVDDVLDLIWAWVGTVRRSTARFFAEKRSADTASDLADALWDHPTQPLSGPSLAGTFDEEAVRVVLDALTPENSVVFDARKHATDGGWTREPWHGATYRSDRTGDDVLARWARASDAGDSRLALPKPNRYVAEDLSLVDDPDDRAGVYRLPGTGRATVWRRADLADAPPTVPKVPKAPAFNRLRTVEQLGYIASAGLDSSGGVIGFTCLLQSATGKSPPELEERVEAWLAVFAQELRDLSDADLALKREGLATEILQRPASLRDVVSRDWHEISSGRRKFSHVATRVAQLRDVSREDLVRVLEAHVLPARRSGASSGPASTAGPRRAADAGAAPGGAVLRSLDEPRVQAGCTWPPAKVWDEGAGPEAPAH